MRNSYKFMYFTILQTRRGDQDKSKIFFSYFSTKTYVVTPYYNHHVVMILMMSQQMFNV